MSRFRKHHFFVIAGSVILFGSWLLENYLQKKADEKLQYEQAGIDQLQRMRTMNYVNKFAYEYYRDKYYEVGDSASKLNLGYFAGQFGLTLIAEHDSYIDLVNGNQQWIDSQVQKSTYYDQAIRTLNSQRNVDSLQGLLDEMEKTLVMKNQGIELKRQETYKKTFIKSSKLRKLFLSSYILGSIILGIGYLLGIRKES